MQKEKGIVVALTRLETERLLGQLCQTREYRDMDQRLAEEWKQRFADYCMGRKTLPLANVEIQKIPYLFPAERLSCYSADILLRQYSRVKGAKGKEFKYSDIKKVYTIVIFEKSTRVFHKTGDQYCHHGKTVFDTGLPLKLLQEFYLINLDIFRKSPYAKMVNPLNGWLTLLTTEDAGQVDDVIKTYPWLAQIYREMGDYLYKPEEVLGMYSEALRILDRNTTKYMIEELQKEVEQTKKEAEEQVQQARREAEEQVQQAKEEARLRIKEAEEKAKEEAREKAKKEAREKEEKTKEKVAQILVESYMESGMDEISAQQKAAEKLNGR